MSRRSQTLFISEAQATAHSRFLDLVSASTIPVPCLGLDAHMWTSEDRTQQSWAAKQCGNCPLVAACSDYAHRWRETGGIWAGRNPATLNLEQTTINLGAVA